MEAWIKKHLSFMAEHHVEVHRLEALAELKRYAAIVPFAARAAHVGAGRIPGDVTLHDHQRKVARNYPDALPQCSERLRAWAPALEKAATFARLHDLVERAKTAAPRIRGIGDLAVYDFTQRLGYGLGLEPAEVYLHAGTGEGAGYLAEITEREHWHSRIPLGELPEVWRNRLEAADAEDVLCHFKNALECLAQGREPDYSVVNCGCPGGPEANG